MSKRRMSKLRIGIIRAGAFGRRLVAAIANETLCEVAANAGPAAEAAAFAAFPACELPARIPAAGVLRKH